jgi:hypothetical protein
MELLELLELLELELDLPLMHPLPSCSAWCA